jgi:hypothetical protein
MTKSFPALVLATRDETDPTSRTPYDKDAVERPGSDSGSGHVGCKMHQGDGVVGNLVEHLSNSNYRCRTVA